MKRSRTRRPIQCGIGMALFLALGMARAVDDPDVLFPMCDRTPTPADVEAARAMHTAAVELFNRGEYDRAIENWRDTYKVHCTAHAVLLNVASAYENKGDKESAIAALEAYLKRSPDAPDAESTKKRIEELKKSIPPKADTAPTASSSARPPPPPPTAQAKFERPFGYKPWIAVGAGGAALVAGALLVPIGLSFISEAEDACGPNHACKQSQADIADKGNTGRTLVIAGDIALGVSAGALAGGLVWQFLLNKPRAVPQQNRALDTGQSMPVITPVLGSGFSGVLLRGSF